MDALAQAAAAVVVVIRRHQRKQRTKIDMLQWIIKLGNVIMTEIVEGQINYFMKYTKRNS